MSNEIEVAKNPVNEGLEILKDAHQELALTNLDYKISLIIYDPTNPQSFSMSSGAIFHSSTVEIDELEKGLIRTTVINDIVTPNDASWIDDCVSSISTIVQTSTKQLENKAQTSAMFLGKSDTVEQIALCAFNYAQNKSVVIKSLLDQFSVIGSEYVATTGKLTKIFDGFSIVLDLTDPNTRWNGNDQITNIEVFREQIANSTVLKPYIHPLFDYENASVILNMIVKDFCEAFKIQLHEDMEITEIMGSHFIVDRVEKVLEYKGFGLFKYISEFEGVLLISKQLDDAFTKDNFYKSFENIDDCNEYLAEQLADAFDVFKF